MRVFCCAFKNYLNNWTITLLSHLLIFTFAGLVLLLASCAEPEQIEFDAGNNKDEFVALQDAADVSISYPSNQNGQTYGSLGITPGGLSGSLEDFERLSPDLIAVVAEDGAIGYVKKEDWFSAVLVGSEDQDRTRKEDPLVVYDLDGRTVIGEFFMNKEA